MENREVVDVFYMPFEEIVEIWEEMDCLRDEYIINTIKPIYSNDEVSLYRTVKRYEEIYK